MNYSDLEQIEVELAFLVRRATSLATDMSAGNLDRSGYLLLNQITAGGPTGARALADALQLDISTVSRQVAALENKGYVRRSPDPSDGRAYFFEMTESGHAAHEEYKRLRIERIEARTKGWTAEEKTQFGRLLEKFNHPAG